MLNLDETVEMVMDFDDSLDKRQAYLIVLEALDLAASLWPKPSHATVTLETHQWIKLRRVLLALPDLWWEAYQ